MNLIDALLKYLNVKYNAEPIGASTKYSLSAIYGKIKVNRSTIQYQSNLKRYHGHFQSVVWQLSVVVYRSFSVSQKIEYVETNVRYLCHYRRISVILMSKLPYGLSIRGTNADNNQCLSCSECAVSVKLENVSFYKKYTYDEYLLTILHRDRFLVFLMVFRY